MELEVPPGRWGAGGEGVSELASFRYWVPPAWCVQERIPSLCK